MIKVLQIGLGPLGQKIGHYITERKGIKTIAAVDKNPNYIGQDFGQLCGQHPSGVTIKKSVAVALEGEKPDVRVFAREDHGDGKIMGHGDGEIMGKRKKKAAI